MTKTRSLFSLRGSAVIVMAACLAAGAAQAQDLGSLEAQMRKATDDARAKQQSGAKSYSVQSASSFDADLNAFISAVNSALNCANTKTSFAQQYAAKISQGRQMLGYAQQLMSNPTLKAFAAGPASSILQAALPIVRNIGAQCQSFGGTQSAASNSKYDQVSAVMKQVFSGGDLGPNSAAVKHAADVDMPARGGNPEALRAYLNSQNGTVKNWYKSNYGLR